MQAEYASQLEAVASGSYDFLQTSQPSGAVELPNGECPTGAVQRSWGEPASSPSSLIQPSST
jgi:hypothetical protein